MQSSAYGASLAGGAFDLGDFLKKPQTISRFLSWIFSIVVFATIVSEGYINPQKREETNCMFNENNQACSFAEGIGILAFLASIAFIVLDAVFQNISNAKDRKWIVMSDLVFSVVWTFLWFICFCVLVNQWSKTDTQTVVADAGRAVIAFSFFSIITWASLSYFALGNYRQGLSEFTPEYTDPSHDHISPYGNTSAPTGYQQSPFTSSQGQPGSYQPPNY